MDTLLVAVYVLVLLGLAVYGSLGLVTLALYMRHRHDDISCRPIADDELPSVTVQLPIFNERFVVERLINAAAALDYPGERLQIQLLDDSTDDTPVVAARLIEHYQAEGIDITLLHRETRAGYKAGALAAGLESATGEFIAIFDADFCPHPTFLRETMPHFSGRPRLGMIQTRWGHLNAGNSWLTGAQAIALDKHFAMEQTVRHRAAIFPKFNGSGGVWRRACLEDAGGWQDDTVCEDLCLSTRAILRGWEFRFLNDVVASAELPMTIAAYKNQQARWAKGSLQCLIKFFGDIMRSHEHPLVARLYAVLAMSGYFASALVMLLLLLQIPIILSGVTLPSGLIVLSIFGLGQPLLFIMAQQVLYPDWRRRLLNLPAMLIIAIGMAPSQCRAMAQVFVGKLFTSADQHPFIRTPKGAGQHAHYKLPFDWIVLAEIGMAFYAVSAIVLAFARGVYAPILLLVTCAIGLSYVAFLSLTD
ncbi:MAG: glycosyltransferase [Anaerolineae bacterium]|nr:glycosyltransferase [Anaerolineae bacterium]